MKVIDLLMIKSFNHNSVVYPSVASSSVVVSTSSKGDASSSVYL